MIICSWSNQKSIPALGSCHRLQPHLKTRVCLREGTISSQVISASEHWLQFRLLELIIGQWVCCPISKHKKDWFDIYHWQARVLTLISQDYFSVKMSSLASLITMLSAFIVGLVVQQLGWSFSKPCLLCVKYDVTETVTSSHLSSCSYNGTCSNPTIQQVKCFRSVRWSVAIRQDVMSQSMLLVLCLKVVRVAWTWTRDMEVWTRILHG